MNLAIALLDLERIERGIHYFTNQERRKHRLHDLEWDFRLADIAREHSQDMGFNNFFSHANHRGEGPSERAERHGYESRKPADHGRFYVGIAENIIMLPSGNVRGIGHVAHDADVIAQISVQDWMQSPGHKRNILCPRYTRLGVGTVQQDCYFFSTQNFW